MHVSARALLPAGATMTPDEIARLEMDIRVRLSIRMEAYMQEDFRKMEKEILYGTSVCESPLGLLRSTIKAAR